MIACTTISASRNSLTGLRCAGAEAAAAEEEEVVVGERGVRDDWCRVGVAAAAAKRR
jgi:hypothetical protein